ncbi:MAG: hypothetical protein L6Q97_06155 [Thermoanaerobaculia bacterium]|nr:hypothetical protein [Thermoanaerobaculia bacterium]
MTNRRAIDNTLPQTAYAYFKNPEDPFLEPNSRDVFMDFVNNFINTPHPVVPVPGNTSHVYEVEEPFIDLWQSQAEIYRGAALSTAESAEDLLLRFVRTLKDKPSRLHWSVWIRFQWTKEIVAAYTSRVTNWGQDFKDALLTIQRFQQDNPDLLGPSGYIELLKKQIGKDFKKLNPHPDRRYKQFAFEHDVKIEEVAAAYAFSWYKRGASYVDRIGDSMILFHELRDSAGKRASDVVSAPQNGQYELKKWGEILNDFLDNKLIERDKERIKDALCLMRDTVQHDGEYRYNVEKMTNETNVLKKDFFQDQAILRVLQRAGMPYDYLSGYARNRLKWVLEDFKKQSVEKGTDTLFEPIQYEIIDRTQNPENIENQDTAAATGSSLWKLYKNPKKS